MSQSSEAATYIRSQIEAAEREIEPLRAALAALEPTHGDKGKLESHVSRSRPGRRNTNKDQNRVLELIQAGVAQGPQVAQEMRVSYNVALRHLRALEREGKVRREGERKQTRWLPAASEEEFLASRTRELAGRSK